MPDSEDEMITFRIAPRDRAAIQRLVEAGEFRNRSDFLRYAVRSTLDAMTDPRATRARMDLELEGVELPPQTSATSARARRGNRKGVHL